MRLFGPSYIMVIINYLNILHVYEQDVSQHIAR